MSGKPGLNPNAAAFVPPSFAGAQGNASSLASNHLPSTPVHHTNTSAPGSSSTKLNPASQPFTPGSYLSPSALPFTPGQIAFSPIKPITAEYTNGVAHAQQHNDTQTSGSKADEEEAQFIFTTDAVPSSDDNTTASPAVKTEATPQKPAASGIQTPSKEAPVQFGWVDPSKSISVAAAPAAPTEQWQKLQQPAKKEHDSWARGENMPTETLRHVFMLNDDVTRYLKAQLLEFRPAMSACPLELTQKFPERLLKYHQPTSSEGNRRPQKGGRGNKGRREEEPLHPDEEKIFGEQREGAYKFLPKSEQDHAESELTKRTAVAILNKLAANNFDKLSTEFCELPVESEATMESIVRIILTKAQGEEFFGPVYADLCAALHAKWSSQDEEKGVLFRTVLLKECQEYYSQDRAAAFQQLLETPAEDREEKELILKKTYLGHMRFIGELYLKDLLRARVIRGILDELITAGAEHHDEEKMECLNKLLITVGLRLEQSEDAEPKRKGTMSRYFKDLKKLSTDKQFSSRIRFTLQDLIEMRTNNWTARRVTDVVKTKQSAKEPEPAPSPSSRRRNNGPQDARHQGPPSRSSTPALPEDGEWKTVPKKGRGASNSRRGDDDRQEAAPAVAGVGGAFKELAEPPREKKRKEKEPNGKIAEVPSVERASSDEDLQLADPTVQEDVPTKVRDTAKATFEEYFAGNDYDELVRCIQEFRAPAKHWQMVVDAINLVFEKSDRARQLLASALVRLVAEQVLHSQQLLFALHTVLAAYDEMIIDIPKAGEYLGFIISELIFARTIEFNFINDAPDEFKDSMKACNLIAQIVRGVQSHSDENTARETYRNASINAAQFVPFPDPAECAEYAHECFAKLGVSFALE